MKRTLNIALSVLSLAGIFAQPLQAGLATPAGIFNKTIVAGKTQYLGTPFVRPEVSTGEISSVSGTQITVTPKGGDVTYTAGEYSGYTGAASANEPYIIEILDGDLIGYIGFISSCGATVNGSAVITVDVAPGAVTAGARFAIRPDWTVETLFGDATVTPIKGTTSKTRASSTTDEIQLIGSNGRVASTIFRKWTLSGSAPVPQTGAGFQWTSTSVIGDAKKLRIPYSSGIILKAIAGGSGYDLTLAGDLREARLRKEILGFPRYNFVANPFAKDLPLKDTGIKITAGTSLANADTLQIMNVASGALVSYYLHTDGTWRDGDDEDASAVTIAKGTSFVIRRASSRSTALTGAEAVKIDPVVVY
jgi:hypothetical protein